MTKQIEKKYEALGFVEALYHMVVGVSYCPYANSCKYNAGSNTK